MFIGFYGTISISLLHQAWSSKWDGLGLGSLGKRNLNRLRLLHSNCISGSSSSIHWKISSKECDGNFEIGEGRGVQYPWNGRLSMNWGFLSLCTLPNWRFRPLGSHKYAVQRQVAICCGFIWLRLWLEPLLNLIQLPKAAFEGILHWVPSKQKKFSSKRRDKTNKILNVSSN